MASKGVTEGRDKVKTSIEAGMMEVDCIMGAVVLETFMLTLVVMAIAELKKLCQSGDL